MPGIFMQRVRRQIGLSGISSTINGRGVTVAVLDTGCAPHPDIRDRILAFRDFVKASTECYDDSGHGTHVCGILCGNGALSRGKFAGIAPAANIVVGKVLDAGGNGTTQDMLEGLEWVLKVHSQFGIRILNISVGMGDAASADKEKKLQKKIGALWEKGIVVVCAAGNQGPQSGTASVLGTGKKVIMVGCHDGEYFKDDPNRCMSYSGRGDMLEHPRKPDVVAPGTNIISCNHLFDRHPYVVRSGTSMATPIVSGVAALLLAQYPAMDNDRFRQRLIYTAKDLGEPWNLQGWGMVSADRLLQMENYEKGIDTSRMIVYNDTR